MLGLSNVSAFLGRVAGGVLPTGCLPTTTLYIEALAVITLSFGAIFAAEAPSGGAANPFAAGGALSAIVTFWCNALLMRLSSAAQNSAGPDHGILCPCPITAQISWVAIQTGCIGGSMLSFVL